MKCVEENCRADIFKLILDRYDDMPNLMRDIIEHGEEYGDIRPVIQRCLEVSYYELMNDMAISVLLALFSDDSDLDEDIQTDILKMIRQHPLFDIEYENKDGYTPLMVAAQEEILGMVRFLVENGADIHHRSKNGRTAYTISKVIGYGERDPITMYLREAEKRLATQGLAEVATFGKNNAGNKLPTLPNSVLRHTAKFLRRRKRSTRRQKSKTRRR